MMTIILSGSFVADANAQNIIGYSESKITVQSEKTYCISNKTLQLTDVSVLDVEGNRVENVSAGSQVLIEASVTSNCEINNYPILILAVVVDSEGMTRYVSMQNTTMSQGDQTTVGFSWTATEAGEYELGVLAHACLNCSGDFGLIERIDFSVLSEPKDRNIHTVH